MDTITLPARVLTVGNHFMLVHHGHHAIRQSLLLDHDALTTQVILTTGTVIHDLLLKIDIRVPARVTVCISTVG